MSILVFVEGAEGIIKKSSKEAISYAAETAKILGVDHVIAVVLGIFNEDLSLLGANGASEVIHVNDEKLNESKIGIYTDIIAGLAQEKSAELVVISKSAFSDNVAGRLAAKIEASIVANVVALPDISNGFTVKKSIFTGKAFANVSMPEGKKVLVIRKNTVELMDGGENATVEQYAAPEGAVSAENITGRQKAEGDILLEDAEIVVSGGRGLKGPENWGMIEDLAKALGAATGCSKPVSDLEWRPHHEHVGQTGVKVSPNLYIAIGISGAIQHLAGVNASKVLVAINKDEDAPFFKAADYGIIGDAFEIVPKLTEKLKSL